jgi:PAS domain S-box-containing protein
MKQDHSTPDAQARPGAARDPSRADDCELSLVRENAALRARLAEAEETLRAIHSGEVEALVVQTPDGPKVFSLTSAESALNHLHAGMLSAVADAVIATDPEHCVTFLNHAAETMYGLKAPDALGRPIDHVFTVAPAADGPPPSPVDLWRGECIHRTFDGRELHVELSSSPVSGAEAGGGGFILILRDITQRKKQEFALRLAEQRLALAIREGNAGVWEYDPVTGINTWGEGMPALLGLASQDAVSSQEWLLFVHPEDRDSVAREFLAFTTGESRTWRTEFRIVRADGPVRWLSSRASVVDLPGGQRKLIGLDQDITERKCAERTLQAAHDTFRHLVEHSPFGVYVVDADFRLVLVSLGARKIFENVKPLLGRDFAGVLRCIWTEPFATVAIGHFRHTLETGEPYHAPGTLERRRDIDSLESYDWKVERVVLPDGRPGVVCHFYDLSERQRYEDALRASDECLREQERRLTLAMDAGELVPWEIDLVTGRVTRSDRLFKLFGLAPSDDLNSREQWRNLIHELDRDRLVQSVEAAKSGREHHVEYRICHPDGTVHWHESHGLPLADAEGRFVRLVGFARDITERKSFQAELERLVAERTARLQELVTELEHFSYSITHDMRAPLRSMAGFAELARELCGSPQVEEQRRFLQRICQSTARMDALIADALSYSEAVRKHLPLGPVDPNLLLRGMLDTYPEFQAARAYIHVESGLPRVLANEAGLTQIFSNLLTNAIKFTAPGKPPAIRIRAERTVGPPEPPPELRSEPPPYHASGFTPVPALPVPARSDGFAGQWVRIWVEDQGPGISPELLPRVFNMFTRGGSRQAGNGIGLALVRKVVDRLGGRVGVESVEGRGSRFWFELLPAARS